MSGHEFVQRLRAKMCRGRLYYTQLTCGEVWEPSQKLEEVKGRECSKERTAGLGKAQAYSAYLTLALGAWFDVYLENNSNDKQQTLTTV